MFLAIAFPSVDLSVSMAFPVALLVSGPAIIKPIAPILADIIALSGARISEVYAVATYRISRKVTQPNCTPRSWDVSLQ
jgi:hypothetical protein